MSIVEAVLEVHDILARHRVKHAFGGALALAYYAEPRGTLDIDVNVFVAFDEANTIVGHFAELGYEPENVSSEWMPVAGVRLNATDRPPLDLFFSLDESYGEIARRCRRFPFGGAPKLPFLSAEDLALFKLSFGRDKDWVDLRGLVEAHPDIDVRYIERQLIAIRGPTMYPRLARLRVLTRQANERAT